MFFVENLTIASKFCLNRCKNQCEINNGKTDMRTVYWISATEILAFVNQFSYIKNKKIILVRLLEQKYDEFKQASYAFNLTEPKQLMKFQQF